MAQFKKGQKVKVSPENDNECYNDFRDKVLIITHVATSTQDHPGYDEGINVKGEPKQALYDLETLSGDSIGCSLYDYELIKY